MIAFDAVAQTTRALIGAGCLWAYTPAMALDLALPLDCTLGKTCYIQQYFDHDPSENWRDFTCGTLAYDGHDGTDFALPTRAAMAAGVPVIAAASGTVKGIREGVKDFAPKIDGKECGNGVVIDHGGGWETQYCHLRNGSVRVKVGDKVGVGTPLGLVGQSGMAEFPHMHFAVRRNGVEIDPFAPDTTHSCRTDNAGAQRADIWQHDLAYQPGGILGAGFSNAVPQFDAITAGLASPETLPQTSPALVLWVYVFGAKAGDAVLFDIIGPKGRIAAERMSIQKNQALLFRAMGRQIQAEGWPIGRYSGTAKLMRGPQEMDRTVVILTITR